eukprot:PITA_25929
MMDLRTGIPADHGQQRQSWQVPGRPEEFFRSKISHCDESRSNQNANTNFYARILGAMPPTSPYKCNPMVMEGFQVDSSIRDSRLTHDGINRNPPPFLQSGLTLSSNHKNLSLSTHDANAQSKQMSLPEILQLAAGRKRAAEESKYSSNPEAFPAAAFVLFGYSEGAAPPITVVLEGRSICQRICLQDHADYDSFAQALRKMFEDIVLLPDGTHVGESINLANAVPGYVIAYEDIDGDLLLAGDLSWKDFVKAAKRIRILPAKNPRRQMIG